MFEKFRLLFQFTVHHFNSLKKMNHIWHLVDHSSNLKTFKALHNHLAFTNFRSWITSANLTSLLFMNELKSIWPKKPEGLDFFLCFETCSIFPPLCFDFQLFEFLIQLIIEKHRKYRKNRSFYSMTSIFEIFCQKRKSSKSKYTMLTRCPHLYAYWNAQITV